jgi:hypothetical protein
MAGVYKVTRGSELLDTVGFQYPWDGYVINHGIG